MNDRNLANGERAESGSFESMGTKLYPVVKIFRAIRLNDRASDVPLGFQSEIDHLFVFFWPIPPCPNGPPHEMVERLTDIELPG
jgi:hypothetical protein